MPAKTRQPAAAIISEPAPAENDQASTTDDVITVNVAVAIKIDPAKWSTKELSAADLLAARIQAEKNVTEEKARELAAIMIENGLADMVATSRGNSVNDMRREIREYVLGQVAGLQPFVQAGATVELNEARRTNHKPKDDAKKTDDA